jgi:cell division protein FtsL
VARTDRFRTGDVGWVGAGIALLVTAAYVHVWVSTQIMQKRYTVQALYQQRQELQRLLGSLETQYRELTALARVDRLAQGYLHLRLLQPTQVLASPSPHRPPASSP